MDCMAITFFFYFIIIISRVLHNHLHDCLGQVKVRFGQAFWKTKKWQLPESSNLNVYCGHTTFNTKYNSFFLWGQVKCHSGKCFSLNDSTCPIGLVVIKTYVAPWIISHWSYSISANVHDLYSFRLTPEIAIFWLFYIELSLFWLSRR